MPKFLTASFILILGLSAFGQPPDRPSTALPNQLPPQPWETSGMAKKRTSNREDLKRIREYAKISQEDKLKHRSFLKQSNTGIFYLANDFGCEKKFIVRTDGNCKGVVPGVWTYSIRKKEYYDKSFQDLGLQNGEFITDGFFTQGILVELGDKDLENISLNDSALNYLVNFEPATELKSASQQYKEISKGIEQNDFLYSNRLKLNLNSTYALRVVAYRFEASWGRGTRNKNSKKPTRDEIRNFGLLNYDKRNDSIYVFKVFKKPYDKNGVKILWKRLNKKKSPKIIFKKGEALTDFK